MNYKIRYNKTKRVTVLNADTEMIARKRVEEIIPNVTVINSVMKIKASNR